MEALSIIEGKTTSLRFKNHSDVSDLLKTLHDYYDFSWPKIAALEAINPAGMEPIPVSTLAHIAETKIVPEKWRSRFGVKAVDNRPRIAIRKDNMRSTYQTIKKHIPIEQRIELIRLMAEDPEMPLIILITKRRKAE